MVTVIELSWQSGTTTVVIGFKNVMSTVDTSVQPGKLVPVQVKVWVPAVVLVAVAVGEVAFEKLMFAGPVHAPVPWLRVAFRV
jgi:hypothetical protein